MRTLAYFLAVLLYAAQLLKLNAQSPPPSSPQTQLGQQTLKDAVADAAKTVLSSSSCKSWPPLLVKTRDAGKSADKLTPKDQAKIQKAQDDFISWLDNTLHVADGQNTLSYSDSFLRLFDTPKADDSNTTFAKGTVADLLGLSFVPDGNALAISGTTQIAMKYNCSTLGHAYASGKAGVTLPAYSVQGGLDLAIDRKNDQTVNFLVLTAESPFDVMYSDKSGDRFRKLFASMSAAEWVLSHTDRLYYVKKAPLFSVETLSSSDDSSSMLANASFATAIPLASASAGFKAQMASDLQSTAHTFKTYIYNSSPSDVMVAKFPELKSLLENLMVGLTPLPAPDSPISAGGGKQSIQVNEEGWPAPYCNKNVWSSGTTNDLYTAADLEFLSLPTPNSSGYPVCQITATLHLKGDDASIQRLLADPTAMGDPGITLTDKQHATMTFTLPIARPLQWLGATRVRLTASNARWSKLPVTNPTLLAWTADGAVSVPVGTTIVSYGIDAGGFQCVVSGAGGASYPVQATFKPANVTADTLAPSVNALVSADSHFGLVFSVGTQQVSPAYNPDGQSKTQCILSGTVNVTTTSSGVAQTRAVAISSTNAVDFPPQLSGTTVVAMVCSDVKKSSAGSYLLASAPASGMACTLVGNNLQSVSKVIPSSKANPGSFAASVTPVVANAGTTAVLTFDMTAIRSMSESAYTLLMPDATAPGGFSTLGAELDVVPLPGTTITPASLSTASTVTGFNLNLQGSSLDQIVQLRLKPQGGASVVASAPVTGTAVAATAVFQPGTLPAGVYEVYAVIDPTAKVEFSLGKILTVSN